MSVPISTTAKISIARWLSRIVIVLRDIFGLSAEALVNRGGVNWRLDLREGFDLSIYLLGGFEPGTLKRYPEIIRRGYTVLDIGANIGAHTLPLAVLVGREGKVIAFEPSEYAYGKLVANIALNPVLAGRILPARTFLTADKDQELPESVYASWPLAAQAGLHPGHHGRPTATSGASKSTLDAAMGELRLAKADFIKLDVDGAEYSVLSGGLNTLASRPLLLVELAPYIYSEAPERFDRLVALLAGLGYGFTHVDNMKPLPAEPRALRGYIPRGGSINVLCSPLSR